MKFLLKKDFKVKKFQNFSIFQLTNIEMDRCAASNAKTPALAPTKIPQGEKNEYPNAPVTMPAR